MIIRSPRPIDVSPKERIDFLVRLCIRERADAVDTSTRLSLCRFRRNSQALVLRCDGSRHRPQSYKSRRSIVWSFIYQLDKNCTHVFCAIRRRYLRRHFISVVATLMRAPIPPRLRDYFAALAYNAHQLDREQRQDAWHKIKNKAAQKRESDNGKWPRRCGNIDIREWEIHVRHIEGPTVVQNFIGQHSRSTPETPTAASRSDCYRLAR